MGLSVIYLILVARNAVSDRNDDDYDKNYQIEQNNEENRPKKSTKENTNVIDEAATVNKKPHNYYELVWLCRCTYNPGAPVSFRGGVM